MERAAVVRIDTVHADGSGAPGVVEVEGYRFAMDFLGGIRLSLLGGRYRASRRAVRIARWAYEKELRRLADERWFNLNAAMYQEGA